MKYDYKKAMRLIEENKDEIVSASLGMREDWGWTSETVFENGEYTEDLTYENLTIAGINGSYWATPTLSLEYKDGEEKMIPCYVAE